VMKKYHGHHCLPPSMALDIKQEWAKAINQKIIQYILYITLIHMYYTSQMSGLVWHSSPVVNKLGDKYFAHAHDSRDSWRVNEYVIPLPYHSPLFSCVKSPGNQSLPHSSCVMCLP
jgi:hypothetical protein